jgi:hypothetical protein
MKAGLYHDMDSEAYFADCCPQPSLTQSLCKILIEQSPLHAKLAHPKLAPPAEGDEDPEKYDKARAIGNAAHAIMIRRGKKLAIVDAPNFMSKSAKDDKNAALQRGEEPILRKHYNTAVTMAEAASYQLSKIEGCDRAFEHQTGKGEVVAVAIEDGLYLRTMMDWLTNDLREVWDLKTSGMSASPYATGKLMASAGWHLQAAMHERLLDAIDPAGAGRRRFLYVAQENQPPYALTVNEIGESALTIGRKQIDYAINMWRRCMECETWPAYPLRIIRPELPQWAESGWINREIAEYEADTETFNRPLPKNFDPKNMMAG